MGDVPPASAVPRRPRPWSCHPTKLKCINGHPFDDRRVYGARHSVSFVGFGHSFYRCKCGQHAFGINTNAPHQGPLVTMYACTKSQLEHIENHMLFANSLEILQYLGYAEKHD